MGNGDCCINDIIDLPTMERIEKLWRTKEIIPLNEWNQLRGSPFALQYFPDDFDRSHTFLTKSELKNSDEWTRKWYSDYLEVYKARWKN